MLVNPREVRRVLLAKREPLFVVPTDILLHVFPSITVMPIGINKLLEEFYDVFPKDVPHGLPPLRGIEHYIDLTLRATLPNKAEYKTNPKEAKEIQKKVVKLIEKGHEDELQEGLKTMKAIVLEGLMKKGEVEEALRG
ncbi:hypothetical protein CR513_11084, partial [Mucuna pruriens]